MAKRITQRERLRKSLKQKIYRLNRKGVFTGTLRQDINEMSLKELRQLTSQKGGRSTFKGLYKYLEEEPMRDYYRDNDRQGQLDSEIPEIDEGENYYYTVLDLLQRFFNEPVPEARQVKNGYMKPRPPEELQATQHAQDFLMDLFHTKAAEEGFSAMGERLQGHAEQIANAITKILTGYKEEINASMNELASILNGGTLTSAQYQEFSDFADSFMGDDMDM